MFLRKRHFFQGPILRKNYADISGALFSTILSRIIFYNNVQPVKVLRATRGRRLPSKWHDLKQVDNATKTLGTNGREGQDFIMNRKPNPKLKTRDKTLLKFRREGRSVTGR